MNRGSGNKMAYVIAEPCIGTKDAACVDACPVDCIHPKKDEEKHAAVEMLYIDPVECIDCEACVPECPVEAIFRDGKVPAKWSSYIALNAERSAALIALGNANVCVKKEPKLGAGCTGAS